MSIIWRHLPRRQLQPGPARDRSCEYFDWSERLSTLTRGDGTGHMGPLSPRCNVMHGMRDSVNDVSSLVSGQGVKIRLCSCQQKGFYEPPHPSPPHLSSAHSPQSVKYSAWSLAVTDPGLTGKSDFRSICWSWSICLLRHVINLNKGLWL